MIVDVVVDLSDREAIERTYSDPVAVRSNRGRLREVGGAWLSNPVSHVGEVASHDSVLEIGCGLKSWRTDLLLKIPGGSVVGYDICPAMLDQFGAESRGVSRAVVRRVRGLAEDLSFAPGSFDGVIAVFVTHHVATPRAFVESIRRVLKPGGWFVVSDLKWSGPDSIYSSAISDVLGRLSTFRVRDSFLDEGGEDLLRAEFPSVATVVQELSYRLQPDDLLSLHARMGHFIDAALRPVGVGPAIYFDRVRHHAQRHADVHGAIALTMRVRYHVRRRGCVDV